MAEIYKHLQIGPFGVIVKAGPLSAADPALEGDMFIPLDLANSDYQEFLAWMAEGNPAPAGWTGPTNTS